jgi:hypothetical protein
VSRHGLVGYFDAETERIVHNPARRLDFEHAGIIEGFLLRIKVRVSPDRGQFGDADRESRCSDPCRIYITDPQDLTLWRVVRETPTTGLLSGLRQLELLLYIHVHIQRLEQLDAQADIFARGALRRDTHAVGAVNTTFEHSARVGRVDFFVH